MKKLIALGLLLMALAGCGNGNGNDDEPGTAPAPGYQPHDPTSGEIRGEVNLARLLGAASRGQSRKMPWAGSWWPYTQDGTVSAAHRYESIVGESGAVGWELANHGSGLPGIQGWWGHCNGWAAAAVLFDEPREAVNVRAVTLGVADQKALLSEVAMEVNATFFGNRNNSGDPGAASYEDVYPNQFLLALANVVGRGDPMVMDRYTGGQVWNHPIAGYVIAPVTAGDYVGPANLDGVGTVHRVNMSLQVWWVRDDVAGDHLTEPFAFADGPSYESRVLRFEVWLDGAPTFGGSGELQSSGNVLLLRDGRYVKGGEWRNGQTEGPNSHPDYFWIPYSVSRSTGYSNPHVDPGVLTSTFARGQ
jgi:hypothetical protein